jgi:glycosyltransferase involved in cell wall biosynthesis
MTRYLVLSDCYPADLSHGRHLRVHHLCQQLGTQHECFLVDFDGLGESARPGIFAGRVSLPPRPPKAQHSLWRLFRRSNARYIEISAPRWWEQSVRDCEAAISRWGCKAVLSFAPSIAEVSAALSIPRVLDWPDSATLTYRRRLAAGGTGTTVAQRWLAALQARRQRGREAELVNRFDLTLTIAEPDRRTLLEVARVSPDRIRVVPNGVTEEALDRAADDSRRERSIVFWGNLDFPPNSSAVRWFHRYVWSPHLANSGLTWHIVGANPNPDVLSLGSEARIQVHGFVEDLYGFARRQGVMVNPMVQGSGLKNKILEAFALRLPVVSTALGVEAFNAEDGRHCRIADTPEEFAAAVLDLFARPDYARSLAIEARNLVQSQFTWYAAGRTLAHSLESVGDRSSRERAA